MAIKHFVRTLVFILAGLGLPSAQALTPQQAGDILVLVGTEVSGTDNVYHYELVNKGTVKMMDFAIGVAPASTNAPQAGDDSYGTLTRLPTGTTWGPAPASSLDFPGMPDPRAGWDIPIPAQGSITSPTGWRVNISGLRSPGVPLDAQDLADERYSIHWYAPKPVYGGSVNVTGADAGQRLAGFSVRVPRDSVTGPGTVGSAANYTQGQFEANVWWGSSWLTKTEQKRRNKIIVTPALLLTFTSDISGNETDGDYRIETGPNAIVTVNAVIEALTIPNGVPMTMRLESITCVLECTSNPSEGISGATFGTDDRVFQLAAHFTFRSDYSWHYRGYNITYSAVDAAGNRVATTSRVTIASKKRY